jgi:hypothetical protein
VLNGRLCDRAGTKSLGGTLFSPVIDLIKQGTLAFQVFRHPQFDLIRIA